MAEAARPERAALPSFSTFSTMAGLAAEALTDSLSHRGGEGKVVVSSRSGYPMRVMVGVVVHPWHPDTTPRQTDLARRRARASASRAISRSKDERRFGVRVASFSRAFHVASRVARRAGASREPRRRHQNTASQLRAHRENQNSPMGFAARTHRLLVRTAEARATTVVAEMQAIFLVGVEEGGEMCVQICCRRGSHDRCLPVSGLANKTLPAYGGICLDQSEGV